MDAVDWPSETPKEGHKAPSTSGGQQPQQFGREGGQQCQALQFPVALGQQQPLPGQPTEQQQLYVERKLHRAKWTGEISMKVWGVGP